MLAVARGFSRHIGQQICIPSVSFRRRTINFLEQASASSRRIEQPQGTIAAPTAKLLRRQPMSAKGLVSRVSPVQTAMRNCTRDEGRSFEVGNQVLISSHRKLLSSKAMVVSVAEKSGQVPGRQG